VFANFAVDIAQPDLKIVIEVDGQSHNWLGQKKIDIKRDRRLRRNGWTVFRVSESGCRLL
jgi:very-short-patch-repair endonuclease